MLCPASSLCSSSGTLRSLSKLLVLEDIYIGVYVKVKGEVKNTGFFGIVFAIFYLSVICNAGEILVLKFVARAFALTRSISHAVVLRQGQPLSEPGTESIIIFPGDIALPYFLNNRSNQMSPGFVPALPINTTTTPFLSQQNSDRPTVMFKPGEAPSVYAEANSALVAQLSQRSNVVQAPTYTTQHRPYSAVRSLFTPLCLTSHRNSV